MLATIAICLGLGVPAADLQAKVSLPPGFYTYADLASALKKLDITLDVSQAPEDLLVISIKSRPLATLCQALEQAGDVSVTPDNGKFVIKRNQPREARLRAIADAFARDYSAKLRLPLTKSLDLFQQVASAPATLRKERLEDLIGLTSPRSADASLRRSAQIALDLHYGNLPYTAITTAVQQVSRGQIFNDRKIYSSSLAKQPGLLSDWATTNDINDLLRASGVNISDVGAREMALRATVTHDKLSFDPITGFLSTQLAICPNSKTLVQATASVCLVPDVVALTCSWPDYLTSSERQQLEQRRHATKRYLANHPFQLSEGKPVASRISHRILTWAARAEVDVVFRASSYADLLVSTQEGDTFATWFGRLAAGNLPWPVIKAAREAHGGEAAAADAAVLAPASDYNILQTDGIWLIIDELRFRDRLVEIPAAPFAEHEKSRTVGRGQTLADVVELSANVRWEALDDSAVPQVLAELGDFYGALPFLRLLHKDKALFAEVARLGDGQSLSHALSGREAPEFYQNLQLAASLRVPGKWKALSPLNVLHPIFQKQLAACTLTFACDQAPTGRSYNFSLKAESRLLWSALIGQGSR